MELTVSDDDLKKSSQNYQNRFELKASDFLPDVREAIYIVRNADNGRVIFRCFERPQDYAAIVE